jgi:hypothetical protein
MKKILVLTALLLFTAACNNNKKVSEENEEKAVVTAKIKPETEIKKTADKNKDGKIDGNDWVKLSRPQKFKLVNNYINRTYKSLHISPSKEEKDKEIRRMVTRLNSFYSDNFITKSAYFPVANREKEVYDAMLAVK